MKNSIVEPRQGRPLVFGHRGAKAYAPMNTVPAFELALEQGADGIELDVHLSSDGELVIVHDFVVDSTTDGSGYIRDMSLAQLKELDAGSWFGDAFRGVRIPTLNEVFEAVGNRLFINVEIKSKSLRSDGIEQAVAGRINHFGLARRVIVSSFNPLALWRFRAADVADVPMGFLHAPDSPFYAPYMLIGLAHQARHPQHTMIDERYMTWVKRKGYVVNTWTVNDPRRAVALRDLGVNAIITDSPDTILEALSE